MNKRATLVQFIVLAFAITFVAFFAYHIQGFDLSKPVTEKPKMCNIYLDSDSISLSEGENSSLGISFYSEFGGLYSVTLSHGPGFMVYDSTILATSLATVKKEIRFVNATPLLESDFRTRWGSVELDISGPAECKAKFSVNVLDNCPKIFNPEQKDLDKDSIGDACDEQTCGNKVCETGEDMEKCCNDCGCKPGQSCDNDVCTGTAFACSSDFDCWDDIACTQDICFHPNTSNAHCGHEEKSGCSGDEPDGCCPALCNSNEDIDCPSDCGNGICEDFYDYESYSNCRKDCPVKKED